jgi:hypothetical protein
MVKKKRKLMAHYECSRCTREWFLEFTQGQEPPDPASLELKMLLPDGEILEVEFEELCASCEKTTTGYVHNIAKQLAHKSPERGAKKEEAEAPSSSKPTQPAASPSRASASSAGSSAD